MGAFLIIPRGKESITEFTAVVEPQEQSENNDSVISDVISTPDPREEDRPTEDSFKLASDFSDSMSDHVSESMKNDKLERLGRQQETYK